MKIWFIKNNPICNLDIGKPTKMLHSILLAQLITILIHYLCTIALTVLADWSTFLELVFPSMGSHNWRALGGGIGPIFTPVLLRRLLGPLGLSGSVINTFWTHGCSKQFC